MAVVLALGVMVLQGCQPKNYSLDYIAKVNDLMTSPYEKRWGKACGQMTYTNGEGTRLWRFDKQEEAVRLGLDCGVKNRTKLTYNSKKEIASKSEVIDVKKISDTTICYNATIKSGNFLIWNIKNSNFVDYY